MLALHCEASIKESEVVERGGIRYVEAMRAEMCVETGVFFWPSLSYLDVIHMPKEDRVVCGGGWLDFDSTAPRLMLFRHWYDQGDFIEGANDC